MNQYQLTLFQQLEQLIADGDAFYKQVFQLDDRLYAVYNYRLASFSDFEKPSGRECRGHTFEVTEHGNPVRLASLPMQKFHNIDECPTTQFLDLTKVDSIELKADGSLISTLIHNSQLIVKSKGSLSSDQASDALQLIRNDPTLQTMLIDAERDGYTVNMEYCSPTNRIVIGYLTAHLKILNARSRLDGSYLTRDQLDQRFGQYVIDKIDLSAIDVKQFVNSIADSLDNIEGYVCRIGNLLFKVKTTKYISLHRTKDSITNPRRLFEAVLDQGTDDLKSMFASDPVCINTINQMEERVSKIYNHVVAQCEKFYQDYKNCDRKTYAIAATKMQIGKLQMLGTLMNLYLNKDPDYVGFLKSRYKELGFKDQKIEQE